MRTVEVVGFLAVLACITPAITVGVSRPSSVVNLIFFFFGNYLINAIYFVEVQPFSISSDHFFPFCKILDSWILTTEFILLYIVFVNMEPYGENFKTLPPPPPSQL